METPNAIVVDDVAAQVKNRQIQQSPFNQAFAMKLAIDSISTNCILKTAHLPCVEGVTRPSPKGAASAISGFCIFLSQLSLRVFLVNHIGSPQQNIPITFSKNYQVLGIFEPKTYPFFTPSLVCPYLDR